MMYNESRGPAPTHPPWFCSNNLTNLLLLISELGTASLGVEVLASMNGISILSWLSAVHERTARQPSS